MLPAAILAAAFAFAPAMVMAQEALRGVVPDAPVDVPLQFERAWLDLPEVTAAHFPEMRKAAQQKAARAGNGAAAVEAWLDYGRVLFNGGFYPEALSALERAALLGLPEAGDARANAAILALGLELAGRDNCRCGGLDVQAEAGASFYAHLLRLSKSAEPTRDEIVALSGALAHQAPAVVALTGPMLFAAAERGGHVDLAGRLLQAIAAGMPAPNSLVLRLNGQYAELRGESAEAFGYYVEAIGYHDENSYLARLHIADMAIRDRDSAALEVVRDFLIEGLQEWHGGRTGLAMLTRLAAVSEALLDAPAALEAMARIRVDYPDAAQARLAGARAEIILQSYAEDLVEGSVSLEAYAQTIRRLRGGLADLTGWVPARMALAAGFEAAGFKLAALAEYAQMRSDIRAQKSPLTRADEIEILTHHLRLLAAFDRKDEALEALLPHLDLIGADAGLRSVALDVMDAAALDAYLARQSGVMFTPDELLKSARIRFAAGDMRAALHDWGNYLTGGVALEGADAANYVYAKYKVENSNQLALDGVVTGSDRAFLDAMSAAAADPMVDLSQLDNKVAKKLIAGGAAAAEAAKAVTR